MNHANPEGDGPQAAAGSQGSEPDQTAADGGNAHNTAEKDICVGGDCKLPCVCRLCVLG